MSRSKNDNGRATKRISPGTATKGAADFLDSVGCTGPKIPFRTKSSVEPSTPQPQCQRDQSTRTWLEKCTGGGSGNLKCASPFTSVSRFKIASYFAGISL